MHRQPPRSGGEFPRAPTQESWDAMSQEERERVLASLPGLGEDRLRFYADSARVHELIVRLVHVAEGMMQQGNQEARRAASDVRLREKAEKRVAALQTELERLRVR